MSAFVYLTGAALSWLVAGNPVGAALSRGSRATGESPATNAIFDTVPLLHCCSRCWKSIQYFAFESLVDVQRIHDMLFCVAAPAEVRALREE